ncbi:DUF1194 domain-containing protein [Maritimibacter sp. DP4N28-5]|uniref:DUF1194 domain-containing protein n=2 Tax=Maritimibacter dapengensis TaxID=2836868 RepID=A0ABS6SZ17_9RHOB|nr:DUF1194 domain-containing protein [Maritimibacter dapengensis]
MMAAALLVLFALSHPASAQQGCRQALVLALDVSGSVDAKEYRLQLDGLAEALTTPKVADAILAGSAAPIAIYVFEWSGPEFQNELVPWTLIVDRETLTDVARTLAATNRSPAPPSTALGTAMATGAEALRRAPDCWRATLDISGDGKSNTGPRPQDLGALPALEGVTVNGLVILTIDSMGAGPGDDDLVAYFENRVIRGPDAFVEVADGFEDYARAMEKKLLREIKSLAVGALDLPDQ